MSKTRGAPPETGAANAIGLLPIAGRWAPAGDICGVVSWHSSATMPASAAASANIPIAARWPLFVIMQGTTERSRAASIAASTAAVATAWPSPPSPS